MLKLHNIKIVDDMFGGSDIAILMRKTVSPSNKQSLYNF